MKILSSFTQRYNGRYQICKLLLKINNPNNGWKRTKLQKGTEEDHKQTKITTNDNKQNGKSKTQTRNITKYKQKKHTKGGWIYDLWIYDFIVKIKI